LNLTQGRRDRQLSLLGPEDALDRRVVLKLSGRELVALSRVARDMQLSPQEAIRSLIMAATLDIKPKPKKARLSP
jgi:hypothetical protein